MTPIKNFKLGLKQLITKSLEKCIECLELSIDKDIDDNVNMIVALKADINRLKRKEIEGSVKQGHINKSRNDLTIRLMNFIDSLAESDIRDFAILDDIEDKILKTILVVSKPEKQEEMKAFFGKTYFPKVDFISYGEALPENHFDVIILEDMPTNSVSEDKMRFYLEKSDAYFLYFGDGRLPRNLQDAFGNKVYFANSPFSLYARLKELLDYIKYFGN